MDIGYWIPTFQFTIYGQRFIRVYHGLFLWNTYIQWSYHLWTLITSEVEATYYFKLILHPLDKTILINGTLILDLLQVNPTRQFLHLMSPSSSMSVYTPGYATLQSVVSDYASFVRMTIFLLITV